MRRVKWHESLARQGAQLSLVTLLALARKEVQEMYALPVDSTSAGRSWCAVHWSLHALACAAAAVAGYPNVARSRQTRLDDDGVSRLCIQAKCRARQGRAAEWKREGRDRKGKCGRKRRLMRRDLWKMEGGLRLEWEGLWRRALVCVCRRAHPGVAFEYRRCRRRNESWSLAS